MSNKGRLATQGNSSRHPPAGARTDCTQLRRKLANEELSKDPATSAKKQKGSPFLASYSVGTQNVIKMTRKWHQSAPKDAKNSAPGLNHHDG